METLMIIFTVFACICLLAIIFYSIFAKEKCKEQKEDVDDYYDEELNSIHDDYGTNDYI